MRLIFSCLTFFCDGLFLGQLFRVGLFSIGLFWLRLLCVRLLCLGLLSGRLLSGGLLSDGLLPGGLLIGRLVFAVFGLSFASGIPSVDFFADLFAVPLPVSVLSAEDLLFGFLPLPAVSDLSAAVFSVCSRYSFFGLFARSCAELFLARELFFFLQNNVSVSHAALHSDGISVPAPPFVGGTAAFLISY